VFLSAIAEDANNPARPLAGLSNLTVLNLRSVSSPVPQTPIEQYLPLFTIDSLRILRSKFHILSPDYAWPNCPSISRVSKSLECVTLREVSFPRSGELRDSLAALLSRMPDL
jgi:hypothetical protein